MEGEFKAFNQQTTPEIYRTPFDETILNMRAAGIPGVPTFIGKPDKVKDFQKELARAHETVKNQGYTDNYGSVTDDGLDVFRIPISAQKKALLDLADEQGCLIEMNVALSLMEGDRGDARTGAELFHLSNGLFAWDPRWKASTKMNVWRIHCALRVGCNDDLDFVLKLATCYLEAKLAGREQLWAEQYFLNIDAFENAFVCQQDLLRIFLSKAEDRVGEMREMNVLLANKLRLIITKTLNAKLANIRRRSGFLVYILENEDDPSIFGIVPESCAGNWKHDEMAILVTATKKRVTVNGKQRVVPHACALVRPDSQSNLLDRNFFLDQFITIGSKLSISEIDGEFFIEDLLQAPAQIKVEYGEALDFSMLMDDFLRKTYKPSVVYDDAYAKELFKKVTQRIMVEWQDERRHKEAKLVSWKIENDIFTAVVAPYDERASVQKLARKATKEVTVVRVFRGPEDQKGWILAQADDGLQLSLECADMSMAYLATGLTQLEGKTVEVELKDDDWRIQGRPTLSSIELIIEQLTALRETILETGEVIMDAIIDRVDTVRNSATVYTISESGIVFSFQARVRNSDKLEVGDAIKISVGISAKESCYESSLFLEEYQINTMPSAKGWKYDADQESLSFPYFLQPETLEEFDIGEDVKERLIKKSWLYGFWPKVIS
jgi:hypothetical protein